MLRIEILTLFPRMVSGYCAESILGKAQEKGLLEVRATDIRDFASGKHRVTDDTPYGGGAGMVMKPEPLVGAILAARGRLPRAQVVLTSPRGRTFTQRWAREWWAAQASTGGGTEGQGGHPVPAEPSPAAELILVCGRYEGVDERVLAHIDLELSLGDFVLTGGELAALCVVDALARLVPGVLGNAVSAATESFEEGLLEYPQYTRPAVFEGREVPAVLQSGDHARIARWRRWQSLRLTREKRPDLFATLALSREDAKLLSLDESQL